MGKDKKEAPAADFFAAKNKDAKAKAGRKKKTANPAKK